MFKRFRQLRISLAAKCQILFGAAVILIIAAALAVPWQRMEQLTEQLNERTAGVLADHAMDEHIVLHESTSRAPLVLGNEVLPGGSTARVGPSVHIISLAPRKENSDLGRFESRAIAHFSHHPNSPSYSAYYEQPDGGRGYRYAQPLHLNRESCARCHGVSPRNVPATNVASIVVLPIDPASRRVGIVSIDFRSRIDENQLRLNRVFLLGAGLLAGTLAIFAFYMITTRLILQPVRVLQETAEKVSKGDLNIRSDISTGDEFQQLSETFNVMLANLKQGADQLRSINKGLDLKLGQLAESNVALYESNRLKSEFLANVSHELRTPLNSILGFADLLKDAMESPHDGKTARYVNNILLSARHLLDLINDLLDLAKIEAGRMEIRSEPLSMSDLFEGLTNILKPLAEAKKVTIEATVGPNIPIIHSDPGKLQQVLYNFLANGIKFSPTEGDIQLLAQRDGEDHVRISVTDHGPGIEPEKQSIIFEKFRQIDGSVTRTHSGTGLGLSISKELTTLMGGSIGVRSAAGEGATFWVVLPLRIQSGAMDMRSRLVLT
jgi:signal transduction histidine kinase